MKGLQFPSCFDPLKCPSFIIPVVAGGILAIIMLIMIAFLYYIISINGKNLTVYKGV